MLNMTSTCAASQRLSGRYRARGRPGCSDDAAHVWGMSTDSTPPATGSRSVEVDPHAGTRSRLAAYDAEQRALATARGAAIARMAQAAAPRRASTAQDATTTLFLFVRDGTLMCQVPGGPTETAAAALVCESVLSPGRVLAPVNPAAAMMLDRLMRSVADDRGLPADVQEAHRQAVRLLRYARNAAVSSKYLLLTEAMTRKFYPPSTVRLTDLRGWASSVGVAIPRQSPARGFAQLLSMVWDEDPTLSVGFGGGTSDPYQTILKSEANVDEAATRAGAGSAATQYAAAVAVSEAWSTLCRVDPILRDRGEVAGETTRIRVIRQDRARFVATPAGAVRVKEGRCILTHAGRRPGPVERAVLEAFGIENGELRLILNRDGKVSSRGVGASTALLLESLHDGVDLLLSAAPFLQPSKRIAARHWSGQQVKPEDRVTRDVPLHVMLAGA